MRFSMSLPIEGVRRMAPTCFAVLLFLAAVSPVARSQEVAEATDPAHETAPIAWPDSAFDLQAPIPFDPLVRTGTLPNGLRWYVRQNQEPQDRAALRLVVNAGSVLEDDDQQGLAHFLEHMAFNGTENFEKQELVNYLESIGMKFGPEINAYTSFDETVYMLMVPTDDDTIVDTAFDVLADWSRRLSLEPEEVIKERGVVLEEWRLGRGAGQRARDEHFPKIFHGARYAERLPIGQPEIIESADPDRLARFYSNWYRPDLMAVIAVGDFDPDAMVARIEQSFGENWGPQDAPSREVFDIPDHDRTLFSVVTDPELTNSSASVLVKTSLQEIETVEDFRAAIVEGLFDGMFNQRLSELIEKADPPFMFGRLGGSSLGRTRDAVSLSVAAQDGGLPRALEAVLVEAKRVQEHGFTPGELERQKASTLRALRRQFQERATTRSESFAGRYVAHFLEESPTPGIDWRWELYQRVLPTITLDEVNALVAERNVLVEENRVITVTAPQKEDAAPPTEEELRAVFAEIAAIEVDPYEDEVREEPLVAALPEPGRVVEEEMIDELELTIWTLSNGNRVLVRPTDFKADEFQFTAFSPGGRSLGTLELDRTLDLATMAVTSGGVGEFSSIELQKKLAGKRANAQPYISTFEEGLRGGGSPEDLETVLQLAHLHVTAPRKDAEAFGALRQRYMGFLANRSSNPNAVYGDTLSVTLSDYHPWSTPLSSEELEQVDLDRAMAFYRERFADVGDLTWVFVGNLDLERLRPLVEQYVATLPSAGREETWRDPGIETPPGPLHKVVHAGVDEKARTTLVMHGPFEWTRENRHVFNSLGEALRIRLREVIREDLSGTYGVQVSTSTERVPDPQWSLSISFGADPQRLDELVAEVLRVLREVRESGMESSYVDKVKEQQRREYEEGLRENGYWMGNLAFRERHGIDQREQLDTLAVIDGLTAGSVADAAAQYLPVERVIRVDMMPQE